MLVAYEVNSSALSQLLKLACCLALSANSSMFMCLSLAG